MINQDGLSAEKRQQIIRGAEAVFTEAGYEGASMSRIAARAGVSKGTLYNYFENKAELFADFVSFKTATTLSTVFDPINPIEPVETVLHGTALRLITEITKPSSITLYRIVISEAPKFPHLARIYWESGPQLGMSHMTDLLQQQMAAGRLRKTNPHVAAGHLLSLCQPPSCMMRRLELIPDLRPDEIDRIAAEATALFLDGYRASEAALPG